MTLARQTKPRIEYTGNSELRTVEGWCCKTCGRFWGDSQHMACWCCATHVPCKSCGESTDKSRVLCSSCWSKEERRRFDALPCKPYDGSAVVQYDNDHYFFDQEELLDWLADHCDENEFYVRDVMLVFAEGRKPRWHHDISDMLCDDLDPDNEWDTSEIDKHISSWVEANAPMVFHPTKIRVDVQSLILLIEDEKVSGRWQA